MNYTREERYRSIKDEKKGELKKIKSIVDLDFHRQKFHLMGETGLINDPNGLSYYNNEYHVFYQWFPFGAVHGLKHWGHFKSKDLVNWENMGTAIIPEGKYESHGAYSGSGLVENDKLYLFYTGNTRDSKWNRDSNQCLAIMDKNYKITKVEEPFVKSYPKGYTSHFRDPKVWKNKDTYYMVVGAQNIDEKGKILLYSSTDIKNWELVGEVKDNLKDFGYMFECPDYFELNNKGIMAFSPQGIEKQGIKYNNLYQSGYIIGDKLNLKNGNFNHGNFKELDRGHDFYAPQSFEKDNRRIMIGWMGMPEIDYPTDKNYWAHCLTIPREISEKNGKLIQKPVEELKKLRKDKLEVSGTLNNQNKVLGELSGNTYELILELSNINSNNLGINLRKSEKEETKISYDKNNSLLIFDRSKSGNDFHTEYGNTRSVQLKLNSENKLKLHIFVDNSSIEIFVNDGEEVFTSRIFPSKDSDKIELFADNTLEYKILKYSI